MSNVFQYNDIYIKVKAIFQESVFIIVKFNNLNKKYKIKATIVETNSYKVFQDCVIWDTMRALNCQKDANNTLKIEIFDYRGRTLLKTFLYSFSTFFEEKKYDFNFQERSPLLDPELILHKAYDRYPIGLSASSWNKMTAEINRFRKDFFSLPPHPFTHVTKGEIMRASQFNEITDSLAPLGCFISEKVKYGDEISAGQLLDIIELFDEINKYFIGGLPKVVKMFP